MTKEQKEEMKLRLEILQKKGLAIRKNSQRLYYSDKQYWGDMGYVGILYYFEEDNNVDKKWIELVKQFEKENNAKVYHITHEYTNIGECLDLLYINDYPDEWKYDRQDLIMGYPIAYVINLTTGIKEIGSIKVKVSGGGLVRVG